MQIGSTSNDYVRSVATDANGNVLVGGFTSGVLPGQMSAGEDDAFVMKLARATTRAALEPRFFSRRLR